MFKARDQAGHCISCFRVFLKRHEVGRRYEKEMSRYTSSQKNPDWLYKSYIYTVHFSKASHGDVFKMDLQHRTRLIDPGCVNCKYMYVVSFAHPPNSTYISIFNIEWTSSYYNFRPQQTSSSVVSYTHIYSPFPCIQGDKKSLQTRICCISERGGKGKPTLSPHPLRRINMGWFGDF